MFVGCGESGMDEDIIEEIEDNYNKVLLDGKNISGVWAKVGDSLESDLVECMVEEVVIIDGETINYHNATKQNGFGFKDNYLFDCTLDDFVFETSTLLNLVGNKLYIAGVYSCDLELEGTALNMIYENEIKVLKKVTGFKEYNFPSSGKTEESGLPVPLNNEIYYRTSDEEPLDIELFNTSLSHTYSKEDDYGRVVFAEDLTSIGYSAFYNCSSLASVTIPDSVTSIRDYAFSDCSSLASITIPVSVTSIGNYAFEDCKSLTSITIPDSVTSIGNYAFYYCTSLPIENNIHYADTYVVEVTDKTLTSYTLKENVRFIGNSAFGGCYSLTSITIPDSVTEIGDYAFSGCTSLKSITIPDSVTEIGNCAFYYCTSLTSITIPDSVTEIRYKAFYNCTSLKSVTIGDSVTSIGRDAFYGCSKLTSITIPDSVTSIGDYAFEDCTSLKSVTIGDSVTSIGKFAFYNCTSLASVYCKAVTPPAGGSDMFYHNASGRKIYVPTESVNAYKSAWYWSDYKSYIYGYDF